MKKQKNVKFLSSVFMLTLLLLGSFSSVFAQEATSVALEEEVVELDLPEAKRIGFFKNFGDRMRLAFIFNDEERIKFALERAEERLLEIESLEDADPKRVEAAQKRYENFVEKAETALQRLEDNADDETVSQKNLDALVRAEAHFESREERINAIYDRMLTRFEENGASEEKLERFEAHRIRAHEKNANLRDKFSEKKDLIRKRHQALTGLSEEEIKDFVDRSEKDHGLKDFREKHDQRRKQDLLKDVESIEDLITKVENSDLEEPKKSNVLESLNAILIASEKGEANPRSIHAWRNLVRKILSSDFPEEGKEALIKQLMKGFERDDDSGDDDPKKKTIRKRLPADIEELKIDSDQVQVTTA